MAFVHGDALLLVCLAIGYYLPACRRQGYCFLELGYLKFTAYGLQLNTSTYLEKRHY
jgi:hypothetical protein